MGVGQNPDKGNFSSEFCRPVLLLFTSFSVFLIRILDKNSTTKPKKEYRHNIEYSCAINLIAQGCSWKPVHNARFYSLSSGSYSLRAQRASIRGNHTETYWFQVYMMVFYPNFANISKAVTPRSLDEIQHQGKFSLNYPKTTNTPSSKYISQFALTAKKF